MSAIDLTTAFDQASGGTFVSASEKEQLYLEQTPMFVYHVEPNTDGVYGAQTVFHIKAEPWGRDQTRLLAFTHSEHRERLAHGMLALLNASPGQPGGPIYLWKYTTKNGNEAWDIKPKPLEHPATTKTTPATPNASKTSVAVMDDNLPF